jgi:hypothetical protein
MNTTTRALALFAAVHATWSDVHPVCDHLLQRGVDAQRKTLPGRDGRVHCAAHVATYTAGQVVVAQVVTRALGYRIPAGAFAAGTALNAVTHFAIDRRAGFIRALRKAGKGEYLDHATAQRRPGVVDQTGPGTALYELDQSTHRLIGVFASLLTTWLAVRSEQR